MRATAGPSRGKASRQKGQIVLRHHRIAHVDHYERLVGAETIDRIKKKAQPLRDLHLVNVNSTYYGGGVAQMLAPLTLLMNSLGIKTGWRVVQDRMWLTLEGTVGG